MIRNITLKVNGRDFSSRLSTYSVSREKPRAGAMTSVNGTEHPGSGKTRTVIRFSLFPASSPDLAADQEALEQSPLMVEYTAPRSRLLTGYEEMTCSTDLSSVFLLNSVDGNTYYRGGEIVLRARRVI